VAAYCDDLFRSPLEGIEVKITLIHVIRFSPILEYIEGPLRSIKFDRELYSNVFVKLKIPSLYTIISI
jgi:hypothetical protein